MTDDAFLEALDQEIAIQAAMLNGDPGPLISYWADCDEITIFGRWGRIEKGHQPVTDVMRWVASRFTNAVDLEHLVIASSGDLADTVGFERSHVSVDGGPRRDMTLRVTHIYRRIDDIDGFTSVLADDAVFRAPGGMTGQGKVACAQFFAGWLGAFPDAHVQVHDSHIAGDIAVEEGIFTGTHQGVLHSPAGDIAPAGSAVAVDYIHVLRYRDGLHVSFNLIFDRLAMLEQLGLIPAPAPAG